jgi:protein required for attachment to host cells
VEDIMGKDLKMVVVADRGHFKAYRMELDRGGEKTPRLELLRSYEAPAAHEKLSEKVSDAAGRFRSGGSPRRDTAKGYDERQGIALEEDKRLIRQVAETVNRLVAEEPCSSWYLAASGTINKRLLEGLHPDVRAKMDKNLLQDLTKCGKAELIERFVHGRA